MAGLDSIFTKSNLEESKKKAKMLFGRVLINLRKTNHIKLYSLLESVVETDIANNKLVITMTDKVSFGMIDNANDRAELLKIAQEINGEIEGVEICFSGKEPFDLYKFEMRLKNEFGKITTIKK